MQRRKAYIILFISLFFIIFIAILLFKPKEKPLKIIMLDIGQGDAVYIEAPHGQNMLIDSGRDRTVMNKIDRYISAKNNINILEISNPDLDHIGGFPFIIEKYKIGFIISPGTNHSELEAYKKIGELARQKNIPVQKPKQGSVYILDSKSAVTYTILWPEGNVYNWERNSGSIIGLLEYGERKILLTGDAPKEVEDQIVAKYKNSLENIDILKVGHHGSKTSTGENLVTVAQPKYAIISAGLNNRYGHPHKEVIELLGFARANVLITSEVGTIECLVFLKKETVCK